MLNHAGLAPTAVPRPEILTALRAEASVTARAQSAAVSAERVRADVALTVAFDKVAALHEAKGRYSADTADDAYRLMMAAQEAAQAMLSAYVSFRERVAAA